MKYKTDILVIKKKFATRLDDQSMYICYIAQTTWGREISLLLLIYFPAQLSLSLTTQHYKMSMKLMLSKLCACFNNFLLI